MYLIVEILFLKISSREGKELFLLQSILLLEPCEILLANDQHILHTTPYLADMITNRTNAKAVVLEEGFWNATI